MKKRNKNLKITIAGIVIVLIILCFYFGVSLLTGNAIKDKTGVNSIKSTTPPESQASVTLPKGTQSTYSSFLSATDPPRITDFYGNLTIHGKPAPSGSIVYAFTQAGDFCGSFAVSGTQGVYGLLHCACGGGIKPTCDGSTISFLVSTGLATPNMTVNLFGPDGTTWDEGIHHVDIDVGGCFSSGKGIHEGSCVGTQYCTAGTLQNWCWMCGCSPGFTCKKVGTTQKCVANGAPIPNPPA